MHEGWLGDSVSSQISYCWQQTTGGCWQTRSECHARYQCHPILLVSVQDWLSHMMTTDSRCWQRRSECHSPIKLTIINRSGRCKFPVSIWGWMSWRTKGHYHYPFLLKVNHSKAFHNPPLVYNAESHSVQLVFFLTPKPLTSVNPLLGLSFVRFTHNSPWSGYAKSLDNGRILKN